MVAHTRAHYSNVDYDMSGLDFSTGPKRDASSFWVLKAFMKGEITSPYVGYTGTPPVSSHWTVEGSSDGVTAGMDGVDRWGSTFDTSKLVVAGSERSWIVLKSPATFTDGPIYVCLHIAPVFTGLAQQIAVTPFTGGSINAPPTSTTFRNAAANDAYFQLLVTAPGVTNLRAHYTVDSEGHFRFFMSQNGSGLVNGFFGVEEISQGTRSTDVAKWGVWWFSGQNIPGYGGYWNYYTRLIGQWHRLSYVTPVGGGISTLVDRNAVASDGLVQVIPAYASIDTQTDGGGYFGPALDWGIKGMIRDTFRGFTMPLSALPAVGAIEQWHLISGVWIPITAKPTF